MALKACKECGKEISSDAKACPHCGKKTNHLGCGSVVVIVLFIFFMIGMIISAVKDDAPSSTASEQTVPEETLTREGQQIKHQHAAWSNAMCNVVAEKKIRVGMTTEQARASWGEPERINETVTANNRREQWIYGRQYIYFNNGILTSYQTPK